MFGKVQKIEMYKTSDGKTFDEVGEAEQHQADIDLRQAVAQLLDGSDVPSSDHDDIIDFIHKYATPLGDMLEKRARAWDEASS